MNVLCRATPNKAVMAGKKIPKSTFASPKGKSLEPSQKWKSLGLDTKYYTAPQSPLKPPRYVTLRTLDSLLQYF